VKVERLYIGCDMEAPYEGAFAGGVYLNAATVGWELLDAAGSVLGSGSCAYVAASDGDYLGVIESTVTAALTRGRPYRVRYTLASGTVNDVQQVECVAAYRLAGE